MLKGVFVVSNELMPIISKYQETPDSNEIVDTVLKWVRIGQDPNFFKPIVHTENFNICMKQSGEVWIAIVVSGDPQAMLFVSYLNKIEELLHQYVEKPLTEFGVKDNFVNIYRVIDVFMDNNFPLCDDFNSLLQFIPLKENGEKATLNAISPWRANGITYRKQSIAFNVTEFVDYSISSTGKVQNYQIRGEVDAKAELNGSPRCSFSFRNSPLFDDICFHRCVDQNAYFATKRVEFVPPQGEFHLLNYRIQTVPKVPLEVKASVFPQSSKIDVKLNIKTELQADNVAISFNVIGAGETKITVTSGSVVVVGDKVTWNIGKLKPGKAQDFSGSVECGSFCKQLVFQVKFQTDQSTSGYDIQNIHIDTNEAQPASTVKVTSKSGHYQLRAGII